MAKKGLCGIEVENSPPGMTPDTSRKNMKPPSPIQVLLAEYDPAWSNLAAKFTERLEALRPIIVMVHHIGSTAVPGLAAKPIIDLMPLVTDLADLDSVRHRVEALGFDWHGELGISGRRYCTLADGAGSRLAQLHFFQVNSEHVDRHVAFRDYLRAHPAAANEYEQEKRRAQRLYPNDPHLYASEKAAWIQETEAKALLWFSGWPIVSDIQKIPNDQPSPPTIDFTSPAPV